MHARNAQLLSRGAILCVLISKGLHWEQKASFAAQASPQWALTHGTPWTVHALSSIGRGAYFRWRSQLSQQLKIDIKAGGVALVD
jgi:hypothetical protein